jgi:tetratricopeptide (TPR) repeat protein
MRTILKYIFTILIICLIQSNIFAQNFTAREEAFSLVQQGDGELQLGQWSQALMSYTNAIETDPEYAEAYMKRGQLNEQLMRNQEAMSDYNMAIQLNPMIDIYYNQRARVRVLSFDYYGAFQDITTAIDINSSNTDYLKHQVDGYISLGRYEDALTRLDSIQLDSPDSLYYWQRKTVIYMLNDNLVLGEKTAFKALEIDDTEYLTLDLIGVFKLKNKDYIDAIKWFDKAIIANPSQYVSYYNRGICYRLLGESELALKDINTSIELNNNQQLAYFKRALIKKEKGDYKGSIYDYNKAISLDSNYSEAIYNRSFTYKIRGDYFSAQEDIEELIDDNESRPEYWNMKGNLQVLHGDMQGAVLSFNIAISYDSDYSEAYYNRGVAKLLLNQTIPACEDFQTSIDLGNKKAEEIVLHFCGY